jgi:hypothetical protein
MAGISKAKGRRSNNKKRKEAYKNNKPKSASKREKRLTTYIENEGRCPGVTEAHTRRLRQLEAGIEDADRKVRIEAKVAARNQKPEAGKNPKGVELAEAKLVRLKKSGLTKN